MTELERMKLRRFRDKYGGPMGFMPKTADEALQMAIECEQTCRDLGPFDVAFKHFSQQQTDLEQIALLLEKECAAKVS